MSELALEPQPLAVAEKPSNRPETQFEANLGFLEQSGEVGASLLDLYREACRHEPKLGEVKLVGMELDKDNPPVGSARPVWATTSGRHEVRIRNDDAAMDKFDEYIEEFDETNQIFADLLGIPLEQLTAEKLLQFAFLHELGHTVLYDDFKKNPDKYRQMVKKEKTNLPIAGQSVRFLTTQEGKQYVKEHWTEISSTLGVSTFEELQDLQEKRYRAMKQERFADNFAAQVMSGRRRSRSFLGRIAHRG